MPQICIVNTIYGNAEIRFLKSKQYQNFIS
jgi:hypothetical protein